MRNTFKPIVSLMSSATAACLVLAACTTEPDEMAEVPADETNVVDADAPAVGVPSPRGDADPPSATPESGDAGDAPVEDNEPMDADASAD